MDDGGDFLVEDFDLLFLRCPYCHEPITIGVERDDAIGQVEWRCPYEACGKTRTANLGGKVKGIVRGWTDDAKRLLE